jgi:hypothetical protein
MQTDERVSLQMQTPQWVSQRRQRLNAYAFVDRADITAGHFHLADSQCVLFPFCHNSNNIVRWDIDVSWQTSSFRRQTRAPEHSEHTHYFITTLYSHQTKQT